MGQAGRRTRPRASRRPSSTHSHRSPASVCRDDIQGDPAVLETSERLARHLGDRDVLERSRDPVLGECDLLSLGAGVGHPSARVVEVDRRWRRRGSGIRGWRRDHRRRRNRGRCHGLVVEWLHRIGLGYRRRGWRGRGRTALRCRAGPARRRARPAWSRPRARRASRRRSRAEPQGPARYPPDELTVYPSPNATANAAAATAMTRRLSPPGTGFLPSRRRAGTGRCAWGPCRYGR